MLTLLLSILCIVLAPILAIKVVIGTIIKKAGIFIKPTLKGKFTFKYVPEIKKPNAPNNAIKKPIAAAEPIACFIENPECFKTGTFMMAPPIPINEDTKPEIKPNIIDNGPTSEIVSSISLNLRSVAPKIAGIKTCQSYNHQYGTNFISVMPTNLYGPNDKFHLEDSHVLPSLIRKFYEAKLGSEDVVNIWGSGNPRREFLHSDDLADAILFLMENYDDSDIVNVGCGKDQTIRELAETIKEVSGFTGRLVFDNSRPDGTPQKVLDTSKINALGWKHKIPLKTGLEKVYQWYSSQQVD